MEDDGLIGMLNFMCNILKCDNVFKFSKQGMESLDQVRITQLLFEILKSRVRSKSDSTLPFFYSDVRIFIRAARRHQTARTEVQIAVGTFGSLWSPGRAGKVLFRELQTASQ